MGEENKYVNVKEEDRRMYGYFEMLTNMYVYREMYFKKDCRYQCLMAFDAGFSVGASPCGENIVLIPYTHDIARELAGELDEKYGYVTHYDDPESAWNKMSDEEQFDIYLTTLFAAFEKRFPEYAKELGLTGVADSNSEVQRKRREREAR